MTSSTFSGPTSPPLPVKWEKWFAWHPIMLNNKQVWLKYVYRTLIAEMVSYAQDDMVGFKLGLKWKYGTIFDVLRG